MESSLSTLRVELTKSGTTFVFDGDYRKALGKTPVPGSSMRKKPRSYRRLHFPFQWDVARLSSLLAAAAAGKDADFEPQDVVRTQTFNRYGYAPGADAVVSRARHRALAGGAL